MSPLNVDPTPFGDQTHRAAPLHVPRHGRHRRGVSAASGVPTFRGEDGLWCNFRVEELATADAFARDPRLVWEWYEWRRNTIAACAPNRAHEVVAQWSHRYPKFTLITQNVDGLHERADTANVVRFHGSVWELSCW